MKKKILALFLVGMMLVIPASISAFKITEEKATRNQSKRGIFDFNFEAVNNHFQQGRAMVKLLKCLDQEMMDGYIENITFYAPRVTGTPGCEQAAEYIYDELQGMDLEVRYQSWNSGGLQGKNVEATLRGADSSSDSIYIICGHYDGVPETEGADDNGAGTASVLAAAKVMSQYTFHHTIRFVLFSGEEQGHYGSTAYVKEARKNNDHIKAALNVDMTGYSINSKVSVWENLRSKWITNEIIEISKQYNEFIGLEVDSSDDFIFYLGSDHYRFWQFGYDAILFTENDANPYYHTPHDTIENMNITYTTKVAKLAMATLANLSHPAFTVGGDKFYVDDDGTADFTIIQDAIDNATIGDIVYVYNGSYSEHLEIDKSIDLIGENTKSTVISYGGYDNVISIAESWIYISGFTIQNTKNEWKATGIDIHSNHNIISENTIINNAGYGIGLYGQSFNNISYNQLRGNEDGIYLCFSSTNNLILGNTVENNIAGGIILQGSSQHNVISENIIVNNSFGVYLEPGIGGCPCDNRISKNKIEGNKKGIHLICQSNNNIISNNEIKNNNWGLSMFNSRFNRVKKNNFVENKRHVFFENGFGNRWKNNYWDDKKIGIGPKVIKGKISPPFTPPLTWFDFDWHPAKKPYEI